MQVSKNEKISIDKFPSIGGARGGWQMKKIMILKDRMPPGEIWFLSFEIQCFGCSAKYKECT